MQQGDEKPASPEGKRMSDKCFKHRRKAIARWHICSIGKWEPVCQQCDFELNKIALQWRYPKTWMRRYNAYREKVHS
jgi:hypothetical protein